MHANNLQRPGMPGARPCTGLSAGVKKIILLVFYTLLSDTHARIHNLRIESDVRKQFALSTFGFYKDGSLMVNMSNFHVLPGSSPKTKSMVFGLSLDKTQSDGISPYLENHQDKCVLQARQTTVKKEDSISVVFFMFDFEKKKVTVERQGEDLKDLQIVLPMDSLSRGKRASEKQKDIISDTFLFSLQDREKRAADKESEESLEKPNKTGSSPALPAAGTKGVPIDSVADGTADISQGNAATEKADLPTMPSTPPAAAAVGEDHSENSFNKLELPKIKNSLELRVEPENCMVGVDDTCNAFIEFVVHIERKSEEGLYNLFFHNCPNYKMRNTVKVDFAIEIVEQNRDSYLSAGDMPLPGLYFGMAVLFLIAACVWISTLRKRRDDVYKIHYLMLLLLFVKSLSLLFHAINFHYIGKDGHAIETWAVLYYVIHLLKGALLFITIILIGAGWTFIKYILSDKDKKIFMVIIPLQILANIAQIIIEESEEGQTQYTTWKEVFILVDLLCCGAILFPVVWSIRHLQEASQTDGKAAINLLKLKLFRHFYIMIVCYIYFTRIIVYLLKITVPFNYEWLDELFRESATFIFFFLTGFKFRPAGDNPYLQLPQEDEEDLEMDEVLTESGMTTGLKKVTKTSAAKHSISKRESSHEYD